jgi:carboxypeptidase C (cathepsin A)
LQEVQPAKDNLQIILQFLDRFPHLKSNPLYIISESYGGHYMPKLSLKIIEYNKKVSQSDKINLAGMAVDNPYVDYYSGSRA